MTEGRAACDGQHGDDDDYGGDALVEHVGDDARAEWRWRHRQCRATKFIRMVVIAIAMANRALVMAATRDGRWKMMLEINMIVEVGDDR